MSRATRGQGVHGTGSRTYTEAQHQAVCAYLRALPPGSYVTVEAMDHATGVPGRTIREIVRACDAVDFLLGGTDTKGYSLARDQGEARRKTAKFRSQARRMTARADQRDAYARTHLPPEGGQGDLFNDLSA